MMEVLLLFLLTCVFIVPSEGIEGDNCTVLELCGQNELCEDEVCLCKPGYQPPTCESKCPGQGEQCELCCFPPETLTCYQEDQSYSTCNGHYNQSFMMAAQVALGAALAIAFVALIALFWKTCPRRNSRGGLLRERESSLTSIQRFVLQRLRDRPPCYDDNNQIQLEKPPAYEEAANITNMQVPDSLTLCYSERKQEADGNKQVEPRDSDSSREQRNSTSQPASTSGMVNPAFTISDECMETGNKPNERQEENNKSYTGSNGSRNRNIVLTLTNEETQTQQTENYI